MVLDKSVTIIVSEKEYKLCFPIRELFEAEKHLQSKNLLTTLAKQAQEPPSLGDLYWMFFYAVQGGRNNMNDQQIEQLWDDAIDELTLPVIAKNVYEVIGKSGVFGKKIQAAPTA